MKKKYILLLLKLGILIHHLCRVIYCVLERSILECAYLHSAAFTDLIFGMECHSLTITTQLQLCDLYDQVHSIFKFSKLGKLFQASFN